MAYCRECLEHQADAEHCFAFCAEMTGGDVAPWVRTMHTYKDGRYVSWDEWISSPAGLDAIDEGKRQWAEELSLAVGEEPGDDGSTLAPDDHAGYEGVRPDLGPREQ